MSTDKKRRLEKTVAALQIQFGRRAIHRLGSDQHTSPTLIPTGFPALDEALNGGIPNGRITEIIGIPTSGMATVTLKLIANAQTRPGTAIYIDLYRTFDPDYAARCGVAVDRLLLARPYDERQGLAMLHDFLAHAAGTGRGPNILVFDVPFQALARPALAADLSRTLGRVISLLHQAAIALLFLTPLPPQHPPGPELAGYPRDLALPHYATLRLLIQKERWLYKQRDIRGYQAQVFVVKNKLAPAGQQALVEVSFNDAVQDDGRPGAAGDDR